MLICLIMFLLILIFLNLLLCEMIMVNSFCLMGFTCIFFFRDCFPPWNNNIKSFLSTIRRESMFLIVFFYFSFFYNFLLHPHLLSYYTIYKNNNLLSGRSESLAKIVRLAKNVPRNSVMPSRQEIIDQLKWQREERKKKIANEGKGL